MGGHTGGAHRNGTSVLTAEDSERTQVSIVDDKVGPYQKYLNFGLPAYTEE